MKWVEYIQDYKFTIKHKKMHTKILVNVLGKRLLIVQEIQLKSIGIDNFKELYQDDEDFPAPYKTCQDYNNHFRSGF